VPMSGGSMEMFAVDLGDIPAIEEDGSLGRLLLGVDEFEDGRFARAGRPDERDEFPRRTEN